MTPEKLTVPGYRGEDERPEVSGATPLKEDQALFKKSAHILVSHWWVVTLRDGQRTLRPLIDPHLFFLGDFFRLNSYQIFFVFL